MIRVRSPLAAVLAAGGLITACGPSTLPRADAQAPAKAPAAPTKPAPGAEVEVELAPAAPAAPKPPTPPVPPANVTKAFNYSFSTSTGRTPWEYEYADVPADLAAFRKLLAAKGKDGWEYAGTVKGEGEKGAKAAEVAVFKRPANRPAVTTYTAPVPAVNFVKPVPLAGGFTPPPVPFIGPPTSDLNADADVERAKAAYEAAKAMLAQAEARAKAASQARTSRMFALKNASAVDVAEAINGVFNKKGAAARVKAWAVAPANHVYIEGTAADTKAAEAIIRAIDQAPADAEPKKP